MATRHLHLVTGKLAQHALREVIAPLAERLGFAYTIQVMPITVAALMNVPWLRSRLSVSDQATEVLLPGDCGGDLESWSSELGLPVTRGPRDLRELPEFFGEAKRCDDYGRYDIEIIAEINHAPRLSLQELLTAADELRREGADVIDVGCEPGVIWSGVSDAVRALREAGHRVSIDSLQIPEIAAAVRAGAELVLSVNSSNRAAAADWGCEVVAIPDQPDDAASLDETVDSLTKRQVPLRIDPIVEPLGFGFAASLGRYLTVRKRYPEAAMMMGIGNLTELVDADSAGINVLMLGFCQELSIRSVLTTQVISWARSAVRECDLARRLVHYCAQHRVLPKHLEPNLVLLRDPPFREWSAADLEQLAHAIRDRNYRIFVAAGELHVITAGQHWHGTDPFALLAQMQAAATRPLAADHAFYLGYELAKARTALTLGKAYRQDEALRWGFLTQAEPARHRDVVSGAEEST